MEFKKYFVDEFNYLFEICEENLKILQYCFLNCECPDKFIREVIANPARTFEIFGLAYFEENVDKFIEFIHLCRKEEGKKKN